METNQISFSAVPEKSSPSLLNHEYRNKLKRSLLSYVKMVEEHLKVDLYHLKDKLECLNMERRFSPAIFAAHAHLRDSVKEGNVTRVIDAIHNFSLLSENEIYDADYRIGSILTESWEPPFIETLRAENPKDDLGNPLKNKIVIRPILSTDLSSYGDKHDKALRLMQEIEPNIFSEFSEYVTRLKLFHGQSMQGATSPRFFGNIFLRIPDEGEDPVLYFIEHFIHEVSHLHLYTLMSLDPLILNSEQERFKSPIRIDERPMLGIYHATFVLARITRAFKRLRDYRNDNLEIQKRLNGFTNWFEDGYKMVATHAKLTPSGQQIMFSMKECVL